MKAKVNKAILEKILIGRKSWVPGTMDIINVYIFFMAKSHNSK